MTAPDSNRVTLLVLLDLSAAFDTIDREILISRLSSRIGVNDVALQWFKSYLADWSTRVELGNKTSHPTKTCIGLPQGSVFGPLGYSIYTLPVGDIARHHGVSYHVYADPKFPSERIRVLDILNKMLNRY